VAEITGGPSDQGGEQVLEFVAGQQHQPGRCRVAGPFGKGRHHQEGVGKHGQPYPPVPGVPAAHLVLIQADKALAGLKALLDPPALSGDPTRMASGTGRGIQQR
jgi:hypothetical protein